MEKEQVAKLDKIVKTDAEWRAELTPEQYYVMRKRGRSQLSLAPSTGIMQMEPTAVAPVEQSSLAPTPSSSLGRAGPAFPCRPMPKQWSYTTTIATA